jgi:hypothetical protein
MNMVYAFLMDSIMMSLPLILELLGHNACKQKPFLHDHPTSIYEDALMAFDHYQSLSNIWMT